MNNIIEVEDDSQLIGRIGRLIEEARHQAVRAVNVILVKTYWEIGKEIVEHELGGKARAEYGTAFLKKLAADLTRKYGRGFSYRNIRLIRQFYNTYEIWQTPSAKSKTDSIISTSSRALSETKVPTVSAKSVLTEKMLSRLSWSHICLLLAVSDKDARSFYEI